MTQKLLTYLDSDESIELPSLVALSWSGGWVNVN
jgi:hypothetical protein